MNANSHTLFFHLIPNTTKSPCTHTHTYSDETKKYTTKQLFFLLCDEW